MQSLLLSVAFLAMLFSKDCIRFMVCVQFLLLQFNYREQAVGFPLLAEEESTCEDCYGNYSHSEVESFHLYHLLSKDERFIFSLIVYNHNIKLCHILFSIAKKKEKTIFTSFVFSFYLYFYSTYCAHSSGIVNISLLEISNNAALTFFQPP